MAKRSRGLSEYAAFFYVLVEPENFDIALGIYDRLRREKKVYGVGLINTKDLEKYDTAPAGTLAEVVTSQNKYARQYSNMLLGKVQMCERYEDLQSILFLSQRAV